MAREPPSHNRLRSLDHPPIEGAPVVFAEYRRAPGKPTILIYGHYDVQPPDPLEEWRSPPFSPTILGDYFYGRGVSDDKGQLLFVHIKAIESLLKKTRRLPVNVICLFEGEKDIGNTNLGGIATNKRFLFEAARIRHRQEVLA